MGRRGHPLLLGHRGFSARYPENTMLAFRQALMLGADGLEFDVQLSADGTAVVMHDASVDRTTNGHGNVAELTDVALRRLNAATCWPELPHEPVPSLQGVLDMAKDMNAVGIYNIEIKTYTLDWKPLVHEVIRVCRTHQLASRLLFSSFNHDAIRCLKEHFPQASTGLLFERHHLDARALARAANATAVNMAYPFVTQDFVKACHQSGLQVAAWTVDDPSDVVRVASAGVDMIMSNHVDVALQALHGYVSAADDTL